MGDFSGTLLSLQSPSPTTAILLLRLHLEFVQQERVKVTSPQAHLPEETAVYRLAPRCFGHTSSWRHFPQEHMCHTILSIICYIPTAFLPARLLGDLFQHNPENVLWTPELKKSP